jgi:hypothetical protein
MAWTFSSRVTGGEPLLTLGPFPSVLVCLSGRNPGPSVGAAPSFDLSLASGRVTIHIVSTARANARRPTVCARELAAHGQEMPPAWVVRSAGEMQGLGRDMASRDAGGGLRNVIPNPLREIPNERSPTEEKPPLDRNPVPLTTPTDTGGYEPVRPINRVSSESRHRPRSRSCSRKWKIKRKSASVYPVRPRGVFGGGRTSRRATRGKAGPGWMRVGKWPGWISAPSGSPFGDGHPPRGRRVV